MYPQTSGQFVHYETQTPRLLCIHNPHGTQFRQKKRLNSCYCYLCATTRLLTDRCKWINCLRCAGQGSGVRGRTCGQSALMKRAHATEAGADVPWSSSLRGRRRQGALGLQEPCVGGQGGEMLALALAEQLRGAAQRRGEPESGWPRVWGPGRVFGSLRRTV